MPIRPEQRRLYPPPAEWRKIRKAILERAGNACECRGECGHEHDGGAACGPRVRNRSAPHGRGPGFHGAGLAAPQIGVDLQLVIFGSFERNPRYPDRPTVPPTVLINPTITPLGDLEENDWEGCLSVPGLRGKVPRFTHIRYSGFDQYGDPIERTVDGFHARVVQHECDHLIGKLYPMRVRDFSRFGYTEVLFPGLDDADD